MMEGIQSDKSHLLPSSVTGLERGKGGKKSDTALSGHAENKATRSDHRPANNFSAHRQWLCVTRSHEETFLNRPGSFSNPGTSKVQGPKTKPKLIKYQCPG